MSAASKLTGYQLFVGVGIGVTSLLAGAIFVEMLGQAEKLGAHGARLATIETGVVKTSTDVVGLQRTIGEGFIKVDSSLSLLKTTMDRNAADPSVMITNLGLAEPGDVFGAIIYNDALWAFPATEAMAKRLTASGLERVQVNNALHGFKIMSINAGGVVSGAQETPPQ
ncbi:hypothetical protein [Mesorhizobium temperatum]|uniref:Uncharacterized protein n=1 Tax=Mesorhizobium temperatum TaxID=241416 RepID=A0A271L8N5_9HYPH|nr:hypothetical protein [Mesorhizobium temperatum]PAQ04462.1 hypothetical protein CIT26_35205 [Mesorhizobium temperatum]